MLALDRDVCPTSATCPIAPLNISPCRSADSLRGADYCMAANAQLLYADLRGCANVTEASVMVLEKSLPECKLLVNGLLRNIW